MTISKTAPNPYWNERVAAVFSHLLVVGMMVSIAVSAAQFGARLFPGWNGNYLLGLTAVVTFGAFLGKRFLRGVGAFQGDWFVYRAAEFVVLAISIRVWLYFYRGISQLPADISAYGFQFINYFQDPEYVTILVFSIFVWMMKRNTLLN